MASFLADHSLVRLAAIMLLLCAAVPLILIVVHGRLPGSRDGLLRRWAARGRIATLRAVFQPTPVTGPEPAQTIVLARGAGGIVAFNGEQIAIDRFGSVSFMMHGLAGPRLLKISELDAVRLRSAKRDARGHLQLVVRGVSSASPAADAHTVIFDSEQQAEFQHIAGEIRLAIKQLRKPAAAPPVKALPAPRPLAPESAAKPSYRRRRPNGLPVEDSAPMPAAEETVVFTLPPVSQEQAIPDPRMSTAENRKYFIARWAYRTPAPEAQQNLSQSG